MKTAHKRWLALASFVLVFVLLVPGSAAAQVQFTRIVTFGTSLSDPGNAFALIGVNGTPPYSTLDQFLVPDRPYAKGGNHFSNGATWIEQFARPLGLAGNARPAFRGSNNEATNYAIGGARASGPAGGNTFATQVGTFLADFGGAAPGDALYVVEMGGDDVRDVVTFADPALIGEAIDAIKQNVQTLYAAGARKFLIWNAPDISLTPAIAIADELFPGAGAKAAAFGASVAFNTALDGLLSVLPSQLPGIQIAKLDVFSLLHAMVLHPDQFDLDVVDKACIMPNTPPFECKMPDGYLFWDGIHPTKAVQAIVAQAAAMALAGQ